MREIKFRAYKKGSIDPMVYFTPMDMSEWGFDKIQSYFHEFNGVNIMQYTGLKDQKRTEEYPEGQEIYKGDLVVDRYTKVGYYPVVFLNGGFKVKGTPRGDIALGYLVSEGTEVVGNIYEKK